MEYGKHVIHANLRGRRCQQLERMAKVLNSSNLFGRIECRLQASTSIFTGCCYTMCPERSVSASWHRTTQQSHRVSLAALYIQYPGLSGDLSSSHFTSSHAEAALRALCIGPFSRFTISRSRPVATLLLLFIEGRPDKHTPNHSESQCRSRESFS